MNNNTQTPNENAAPKPAKSPLQKLVALTAANLHVNRGTLETLTRIDESLSCLAIGMAELLEKKKQAE